MPLFDPNPYPQAVQELAEIIDMQSELLVMVVGMLVDKGIVTPVEFKSRITALSRLRPELESQLLGLIGEVPPAQR